MGKENEDAFAKAVEVAEEKVKTEKIVEEQQKLTDTVEPDSTATDSEEPTELEDDNDSEKLIDDNFKPQVSSKSRNEIEQERGVKKEQDDAILTIDFAEFLPPKTKKLGERGPERIPPKETDQGSKYYEAKLKVRFKEDNLVEYYPSIRYWVNDGKVSPFVNVYREGHNKVAQLFRLALQKMSNNAFELEEKTVNERQTIVPTKKTADKFEEISKTISDQEILDWLKDKKVKISVSSGNYNGKDWFRNDIKEFVN